MVLTSIDTDRDGLFYDVTEAEGAWQSPSASTMQLRRSRAVASDSSLPGTPSVHAYFLQLLSVLARWESIFHFSTASTGGLIV